MNDIVLQKDLMDKAEYLGLAMEVTDLSLRDVVNNKAKAYQRLRRFMGRDQLEMDDSSREDVRQFLSEHKKVVGKLNKTDGLGFRIYDSGDPYALEQIIHDAPSVLEEYITQHPMLDEIYDQSVNTVRIHTIRNEYEVKTVFNPLLSIGAAGSNSDHPICDRALRILLAEDGTIISGIDRWRCYEKMEYHPDTGYRVIPGKCLPYIREACEMCLEAAMLFPELRYLGWDVAITQTGPTIVEVNGISGLAPKYCSSREIHEMFQFISGGTEFCYNPLIRAKRFVPDIKEMPNNADVYLLCLQSALHRHGIEFTDRNDSSCICGEELTCVFSLNEQKNTLSATIEGAENVEFLLEIPQAETGENDLFSIERMATKCADKIYKELRKAAHVR